MSDLLPSASDLRKKRNETPHEYCERMRELDLHVIAAGRSLTNLKHLIEGGFDIQERDRWRMSALHWCEDPKVAKALMAGATRQDRVLPWAVNEHGDTPLHTVQNPAVIKLMLENKGKPNTRNKQGFPAWARATSPEAAQLFLDYGADLKMKIGEHDFMAMLTAIAGKYSDDRFKFSRTKQPESYEALRAIRNGINDALKVYMASEVGKGLRKAGKQTKPVNAEALAGGPEKKTTRLR